MKTNLLTKEEHEYLSAVIKPFRKEVTHIIKYQSYHKNEQWLAVDLLSYRSFNFPYFTKDKYYKNLTADKYYTLEELGL